jgi:DNA polymerase III delta prime subunit
MIFINYLLDNIDKYYKYFDNVVINNILSNNTDFNLNHIHLYGNAGSMKNFYIYYIINKLTKNTIKHDNIKIQNELININNNNIEFLVTTSKLFIELNIHNNNNNDKHIITKYVMKIISNKSYQDKHIIILKDFDKLSNLCHMALRRIMEYYNNNVLFIFVSSNLSKIPQSIKSRCLNIRCPMIDKKKLKILINHILNDYNKNNTNNLELDNKQINLLIKNCEYDIYKILLNLETQLLSNEDYVFVDNLYNIIKIQLDYLKKTKNIINVLKKNREFIYNLIYFNYDNQIILEQFLKILLSKYSKNIVPLQIVKLTAEIDHNIIKSSREFYHYEFYLTKIYTMFHR